MDTWAKLVRSYWDCGNYVRYLEFDKHLINKTLSKSLLKYMEKYYTTIWFTRIRFHDDAYRSFDMSHGSILSNTWHRWKNFFFQSIVENHFNYMAVLVYTFIASVIWLGKIRTRAFWTWVSLENKIGRKLLF